MEIKNVGVLGCGLMGAGIAQVAAASGFKTIVREVNQGALDKGMARIKQLPRRWRVEREGHDRAARHDARQPHRDDAVPGDEGLRHHHRSDRRERRGEGRGLHVPRGRRQPEHDLRVEHLVALHHRARGKDEAARSLRRAALLQSSPADEARRGRPGAHDERRDLSRRSSSSRRRSARIRSPRPTSPASSSIACSCRTCSTRFAATSAGSARSRTSTRG